MEQDQEDDHQQEMTSDTRPSTQEEKKKKKKHKKDHGHCEPDDASESESTNRHKDESSSTSASWVEERNSAETAMSESLLASPPTPRSKKKKIRKDDPSSPSPRRHKKHADGKGQNSTLIPDPVLQEDGGGGVVVSPSCSSRSSHPHKPRDDTPSPQTTKQSVAPKSGTKKKGKQQSSQDGGHNHHNHKPNNDHHNYMTALEPERISISTTHSQNSVSEASHPTLSPLGAAKEKVSSPKKQRHAGSHHHDKDFMSPYTAPVMTTLHAQQSLPPTPIHGGRQPTGHEERVALEPGAVDSNTSNGETLTPVTQREKLRNHKKITEPSSSAATVSPRISPRTKRPAGRPTNNVHHASPVQYTKQLWENRRSPQPSPNNNDNRRIPAAAALAAIPSPNITGTVLEQTQQPSEPHDVGAFAINIPAPILTMVDDPPEDDDDWEQFHVDRTGQIVLDAQVEVNPGGAEEAERNNNDIGYNTPKYWSGKRLWIAVGLTALAVVAVIIVIAVTVAGGGSDENNVPAVTSTPTSTPVVEEPTPSPAITPASPSGPFDRCFGTTHALTTQLRIRSGKDPDFSGFADIRLCPRMTYYVTKYFDDDPVQGDSPPLLAQSNTRFSCGDNGSLEDRCIMTGNQGGTLLAVNSDLAFEEKAASNVTFEGITFERPVARIVDLFNAGEITFKNCLFRFTTQFVPIIIDYRPEPSDTTSQQIVTFDGCIFENLDYSNARQFFLKPEAYTDASSLVMITEPQNKVIFRDCVFRSNQPIELPSGLITSQGGEIEIERTCFYSNPEAGVTNDNIILFDGVSATGRISVSNVFVDGPWNCGSVAERSGGTNVTCQTNLWDASSLSDSCQASANNVDVAW
eukprot:scaffold43448_cov199-Amphora_coffeaeformis.AAC.3